MTSKKFPRPFKTASVIGVGKLGSPLVACLAHKGFKVIGVDLKEEFVKALNAGHAPVLEPGLEAMIHRNRKKISATTDIRTAVLQSDLTFIIVATPTGEDGGFSLKYVIPVVEAVGKALREKKNPHLVVLTSTVMPGATDREVLPLLEKASGKVCGRDFGLCYNPEFIALGSVIRDFQNPDFILIGESDPESGNVLEKFYHKVCNNRPGAARMNFVNAELAKLSVNTFVTTKITFSNTLARICEKLPGGNVDQVTSALGRDSRIGLKYLKGAIGYGGPCFPRDTVAFSSLAKSLGVSAYLSDATHKTNRDQVMVLKERIKAKLPLGKTVGILGLSYKPDTDVIEESQGILLARALHEDGISVTVFDPLSLKNARKVLGESIQFNSSAEQCIRESHVTVIVTPWKEFASISPKWFHRKGDKAVLIDCWRLLNTEKIKAATDYLPLGFGMSRLIEV